MLQAQAQLSKQLVVARQQHAEVCAQLQKEHAAAQQAALQEHHLQKVGCLASSCSSCAPPGCPVSQHKVSCPTSHPVAGQGNPCAAADECRMVLPL